MPSEVEARAECSGECYADGEEGFGRCVTFEHCTKTRMSHAISTA